MYTPPWFAEEDKKTLVSFMREYPFASLISYTEDGPIASHLPLEFLADEREEHGVLVGHVARQNPHWRSFKSKNESLIIFSGPHEYISPSWYKSKSLVPTWNYAAVHAYGHIEVIEEEQRVRDILNLLIDRFESPRAEPWVNELVQTSCRNYSPLLLLFRSRSTAFKGNSNSARTALKRTSGPAFMAF